MCTDRVSFPVSNWSKEEIQKSAHVPWSICVTGVLTYLSRGIDEISYFERRAPLFRHDSGCVNRTTTMEYYQVRHSAAAAATARHLKTIHSLCTVTAYLPCRLLLLYTERSGYKGHVASKYWKSVPRPAVSKPTTLNYFVSKIKSCFAGLIGSFQTVWLQPYILYFFQEMSDFSYRTEKCH